MARKVEIYATSFSGIVDLTSFKSWSLGGKVRWKLRRGDFYIGKRFKNLLIKHFANEVETGSVIKFVQIITPGDKMGP